MIRHDINISNTIHRHITWYNEVLFLEDVANIPIIICVGENDSIFSVNGLLDIVNLTKSTKHHVIFQNDIGHNDFLTCDQALQKLKTKMTEMNF